MSLQVWLPLNGDLKNQGCTDYTITAFEASPTFTAGKIGQCYQRANTSSQITNGLQIQDNLVSTFGTTASVAVWVKPLGTHTHYNGTILSSGDWNKKRWAFGVSQDNSQVDVLCGGYNNYISCPVPVNQWTHLVSTFENGVCKLYKNGVYVGEKSGQAAFDSDANWTGICRETYAGGYFGFNGCINDLRIYDHVLSAAEVREISQGLVLHWKLDSIDNNIMPDSSGYGHTGTLISPQTLDSTTPRYNKAYSFNGNISHRCYWNGTAVNYADNFSYSVWIKANYTGTAAQYLFTVGRADAGGYGYGIQNNSATNLVCRFGNAGYNIAITANTWTHIAFTKNGTNIKIYKNGVQYSNNTFSGTLPTFSDGNGVGIGCFHYTGDIYPGYGSMSDFRIYATAISAADILQLYHTSAKVDNKQNLHTFELIENSSAIKINKRGQTLCNELEEDTATKFYKTNKIIETNEIIEF